MQGKVGVGSAEPSNEVILERADGTFSIITAMDAWGHKLVVRGCFVEVILEGLADSLSMTWRRGLHPWRTSRSCSFL